MLREELYDYVFKRALAEVDELINLAEGVQKDWLRGARHLLLESKDRHPDPRPAEDKPWNTHPWPPKFKTRPAEEAFIRPVAPQIESPEGAVQEKVSEKLDVQEEFSDDPRENHLWETCSLKHQVGTTQVYLDFAGTWITAGGAKAIVAERRKDGGWDGVITGVGAAVWDEAGRGEVSSYDLTEKIREGKDYK